MLHCPPPPPPADPDAQRARKAEQHRQGQCHHRRHEKAGDVWVGSYYTSQETAKLERLGYVRRQHS